MASNILERFWNRVCMDGDCWLWRGEIAGNGYGVLTLNYDPKDRRRSRAHVFSWEIHNKVPVPKGLCLDHLCRVRACVNPTHLEPVTQRENILRGISSSALNAKKTHCKRGHPLSGENLFICQGTRQCCICSRAKVNRYRARIRAAKVANQVSI